MNRTLVILARESVWKDFAGWIEHIKGLMRWFERSRGLLGVFRIDQSGRVFTWASKWEDFRKSWEGLRVERFAREVLKLKRSSNLEDLKLKMSSNWKVRIERTSNWKGLRIKRFELGGLNWEVFELTDSNWEGFQIDRFELRRTSPWEGHFPEFIRGVGIFGSGWFHFPRQNEREIDICLPWHYWDATMRRLGAEQRSKKYYIWVWERDEIWGYLLMQVLGSAAKLHTSVWHGDELETAICSSFGHSFQPSIFYNGWGQSIFNLLHT